MRRDAFMPAAAFAAAILLAALALWPVWRASPYRIASERVSWSAAAADLRPQHLLSSDDVRTLRAPASAGPQTSRQYEYAFDRAAAPRPPAGVLMFPVPADARLYVNGLELDVAPIPGRVLFAAAAPATLQSGLNRIQIVAPKAAPTAWPRALYFGPEESLRAAGARAAWIMNTGPRFIALLAGIAAACGFIASAAFRRRRSLFLPSCAALAMALEAIAAPAALSGSAHFGDVWARYVLGAIAALVLLWIVMGDRRAWPVQGATIAMGLLLSSLALWPIDLATATFAAHWLGTGLVLLCAAAALAGQMRSTLSPLARGLVTLTAAALFALAAARIDLLGADGFVQGQAMYASAGILAAAASALWIGAHLATGSYRALSRQFGLSEVVREQEIKLAEQQRSLEIAIAERAASQERERLTREIHDGVGGSLVALLAQARGGALAPGELERMLQQTLADLRMMIDAQDHAHSSLTAAFSTFQTRITPAFAAAGIALTWEQSDLHGRALRDAASLLNVFRILQEACANVIRHASASHATVEIGWDSAVNMLIVRIVDDGRGAGAATGAGQGLRNMAKRAAAIAAEFSAGPNPEGQGWQVRLRVPCA